MSDLSSGAKCIKYTLFIFNMLFLLAGLALIIIGAIVQVQAQKNGFGDSVSGAGIFIIVIGSIVFVVCFFGCAGAINNNYCMIVTFGVFLILLLLAEIAGIITGFVLRNKVEDSVISAMQKSQKEYDGKNTTVATQTWDNLQKSAECCGTFGYKSWNISTKIGNDVPDSCCVKGSPGCGRDGRIGDRSKDFWNDGCATSLSTLFLASLLAVGAVAAAIAVLEIIGIIFAFCLASSLRQDYKVV